LAKRVVMHGGDFTFKAYLDALPVSGGLIQAMPRGVKHCATVHFLVDPVKGIDIHGTSEAFAPFARVRVLPSGGDWPQLKAVATQVGKVLAGREIYGFASVDCVIGTAQGYEEEKTDPLYVVDLDLRMTNAHSALFLFLFMTRCYFDEHGKLRSRANPTEIRYCALTTCLRAPGSIPPFEQLFARFKEANLSFDLVEASGTVLVHADVRGQSLALGTVGVRQSKALHELTSALALFDNGADTDVFQVLSLLRGSSQGRRAMR